VSDALGGAERGGEVDIGWSDVLVENLGRLLGDPEARRVDVQNLRSERGHPHERAVGVENLCGDLGHPDIGQILVENLERLLG
jgi:hypothetical protein